MQNITEKEELWNIISQLRKIGGKEGFPPGERADLGILRPWVSYNGIHHDWIKSHFRLTYQGKDICVGVPKTKGYWGIKLLRPMGDRLFNNNFLVYESTEDSVQREIQTYSFLSAVNFPTFNPRKDLLSNKPIPSLLDSNKDLLLDPPNLQFKDVLITDWVEGENIANLLAEVSAEDAKMCVGETAKIMKRLNNEGYIWCDANPSYSILTTKGIKIHNFALRSNPHKSQEFLIAKELTNLILTSKFYAGQNSEGIEKAIIEGYRPEPIVIKNLKSQLDEDLLRKPHLLGSIREKYFFQNVYELNEEQVMTTKKIILEVL